MGVKGSWKRPSSVPQQEAELRWEYAFRKTHLDLDFEAWVKLREGKTDATVDVREK